MPIQHDQLSHAPTSRHMWVSFRTQANAVNGYEGKAPLTRGNGSILNNIDSAIALYRYKNASIYLRGAICSAPMQTNVYLNDIEYRIVVAKLRGIQRSCSLIPCLRKPFVLSWHISLLALLNILLGVSIVTTLHDRNFTKIY